MSWKKLTGPVLTVSQVKDDGCLLNLVSNLDTLVYVHAQRLFAEHMKAPSGKLDRELGMHPILNANDDCHCSPWLPCHDKGVGCGEEFGMRCKDIVDGNAVLGRKRLAGLETGFG